MNICNHQISALKNIVCTEAFPAKCNLCGCKVIRQHTALANILIGLFAFGSLLLLSLLIVFFEYAGFIIVSVVGITSLIYFISIAKVPLIEYSQEAQTINKKRTQKYLLGLVVFILVFIAVVLTET